MENTLPGIIEELKVQPECLAPDVEGQTSPRVRKLLNRLVSRLPAGEMYFEVGCLKGATLVSALLDHRHVSAVACDNWTEYLDQKPEEIFLRNLKNYEARLPRINIIKQDCFKLPQNSPFKQPIGVYFYDGDHSFDSQMKAIMLFAPFLAKRCVVLVDDWNWDHVRNGTWQGIHVVRPRRLEFWELPSAGNCDVNNYWNGIGAFYLELA